MSRRYTYRRDESRWLFESHSELIDATAAFLRTGVSPDDLANNIIRWNSALGSVLIPVYEHECSLFRRTFRWSRMRRWPKCTTCGEWADNVSHGGALSVVDGAGALSEVGDV